LVSGAPAAEALLASLLVLGAAQVDELDLLAAELDLELIAGLQTGHVSKSTDKIKVVAMKYHVKACFAWPIISQQDSCRPHRI